VADDDLTGDLLPAMADARARFMALVAEIRPELHRYCARMAGDVFAGEDIVQDTLAKAHFTLGAMNEPPPLRPWLFRIAHNAAMDYLRRYERKNVDLLAEVPEVAASEYGPDPVLVEAALTVFVSLPPIQRSALILKDVLSHSLEETASTLGTTVLAVKSALVRARAKVDARKASPEPSISDEEKKSLRRYAHLFNSSDWDGLRALLGEEVRADVVSRAPRRGKAVAEYFSRYAQSARANDLRAEPGFVGGVPVIAMYRGNATRPAFFVRLEWAEGRVVDIRDFYFVPYIVDEARYQRG
jgi:RNA polymerase sigma-70 factor, ECF subfamily